MVRPMRCAAWNMVGAFISVSRLAGFRISHAFGQCRAHRLAERQVAGGGERHDAFARLRIDVQLAEGGDVVEAGIGARIGNHHETGLDENSATIGHVTFDFLKAPGTNL